MLFKKKNINEYAILERIKIDIDECKNPSSPKHEYCEEVARDDRFIFYCYKRPIARFYGYILRQEIQNPKNVVFFGLGANFNVVYENHLFQVNQSGELGDVDLTARNITTGRLIKFDWIGQRAVFCVTPDGYGRFYNQDTVNDVFIENGKLLIKVSRQKSDDPHHKDPHPDQYDITGDFTLVVENNGAGFTGKFVFDENENVSEEKDDNHQSGENTQIAEESATNIVQNDEIIDKDSEVSSQENNKEEQRKKYWLADNGTVRCLDDDCPEECSLDCPIHLQTLALDYLSRNDCAQAARFFMKAVEIEPAFADAWNNLAACYGQMGEHEKAYESYKKAFQLLPKPNPLFGMAVAMNKMKVYPLANQYAKMYVEAYGADGRISSLMVEISENMLASSVSANKGQEIITEEKTAVGNQLVDIAPGTCIKDTITDDMREYGKNFILLLDEDAREKGYHELEKMINILPEAGIALGQYYHQFDKEKAKQYFKTAADAGFAEGMWGYAALLDHSYIPERGNLQDVEWEKYCLAAAEKENRDAAVEMGNVCNRRGAIVEAAYWYMIARVLAHPHSGMKGILDSWKDKGMPEFYIVGTENYNEGRHLSTVVLLKGLVKAADVVEMEKVFNEYEDRALGYYLGFAYERNLQKRSFGIYDKLQKYNYPHALERYAYQIMNGKGVDKNVDAGVNAYRKSAILGSSVSSYTMGDFATIDKDYYGAAYWYSMAYISGVEEAGVKLLEIKKILSEN